MDSCKPTYLEKECVWIRFCKWNWRLMMKVRYDKLWRLMKDNKMKKSDLAKAAE